MIVPIDSLKKNILRLEVVVTDAEAVAVGDAAH